MTACPIRSFNDASPLFNICHSPEHPRNFLRPASYINQTVSLARRRVIHVQRVAALQDLISAA